MRSRCISSRDEGNDRVGNTVKLLFASAALKANVCLLSGQSINSDQTRSDQDKNRPLRTKLKRRREETEAAALLSEELIESASVSISGYMVENIVILDFVAQS